MTEPLTLQELAKMDGKPVWVGEPINSWWENRQFNPDDVYNNLVDCAVTHWMPLPEAPEENNAT